MKALVLAAGAGSRLRPLTDRTPKPMVAIGGQPILEHTVRLLAQSGVDDIAMNLHHLPDVVTEYFGDGSRWGVRIRYHYEPVLLGTAGALRPWRSFLDSTFTVVYGDNLTTCSLEDLWDAHRRQDALATVALFEREDVTPSGAAELDEAGLITRFIEKPAPGMTDSHLISAGVIVLEPEALDLMPQAGPVDFGRDLFPAWIAAGHRIAGHRMGPAERLWWIDTPADLARVEAEFTSRQLTQG